MTTAEIFAGWTNRSQNPFANDLTYDDVGNSTDDGNSISSAVGQTNTGHEHDPRPGSLFHPRGKPTPTPNFNATCMTCNGSNSEPRATNSSDSNAMYEHHVGTTNGPNTDSEGRLVSLGSGPPGTVTVAQWTFRLGAADSACCVADAEKPSFDHLLPQVICHDDAELCVIQRKHVQMLSPVRSYHTSAHFGHVVHSAGFLNCDLMRADLVSVDGFRFWITQGPGRIPS